MNGKRLAAILIIIFALIILISLIYFMFLAPVKEQAAPVIEQPAEQTQTSSLPATTVAPKTAIRQAEVTEDDLKRLAASFVERYGSYSNQSGYVNIRDLKIFMSRSLQIWADNYIEQARQQNSPSDIYYGITTKAITTETAEFNNTAGRAEFSVATQRRESTGTSANMRTFAQTAQIVMVKEGGVWKVDRITWL